jgi:hypothetical protein
MLALHYHQHPGKRNYRDYRAGVGLVSEYNKIGAHNAAVDSAVVQSPLLVSVYIRRIDLSVSDLKIHDRFSVLTELNKLKRCDAFAEHCGILHHKLVLAVHSILFLTAQLVEYRGVEKRIEF